MGHYPKKVKEFVRVRCEQTPNNAQIARDVKNKFETLYHDKEIDLIRRWISNFRSKEKLKLNKLNIKRLFFDIETSYYELRIKSFNLKNNIGRYFNHEDIVKEMQIICISYKWQYEDKVHNLDWSMGEKKMIKKFVKIMGQADEVVGHNVKRFDISVLRTRAIYHGILMFPTYRTLDTLTKARSGFRFASNKLDYIGNYLQLGGKMEHEGFELWEKVVEGDQKALERMCRYCDRDVVLLEDTYFVISPFITHNNNFAVLTGGEKWYCPECGSSNVVKYDEYATPLGIIRRQMKCNDCKKQYKISNKTYLAMLEEQIKKEAEVGGVCLF